MGITSFIYLISASVSLLLFAWLFLIVKGCEKEASHFTRPAHLMAYGLLCRGLAFSVVIVSAFTTVECSLADSFIAPFAYYLELNFLTFAALSLLHSPAATNSNILYHAIPPLVVAIIYLLCFLFNENAIRSAVGYEAYTTTVIAKIACTLLYVCLLAEIYSCYHRLRKTLHNYRYVMEECIPVGDYEGGTQVAKVVHWIAGYLIIGGVLLVVFHQLAESVLVVLSTVMSLVIVIKAYHSRTNYQLVADACEREYAKL